LSCLGWKHGGPAADDPRGEKQAHALLTTALTDPDWRSASQALDDLMRKLLVVHRLLEAEERLAKRERRADRIYGGCGRSSIIG
jgi:hypothetical protein